MQKLTNMRNAANEKIGSPEVRAAVCKDVRLMRRLDSAAGKIGHLICRRIATPKRSNDVAHFIGATVTAKGKRVSVSKLVANPIAGMMKTSPRAGGNFPSRYVTRKDIELSYHDKEEIVSVTRTILAMAMEPDAFYLLIEGDKETRIDLPHWREGKIPVTLWRVLFKATRAAVGMHKIMSRELSLDYFADNGVELDIELAADALEESASEQARRARVLELGGHFRACIEAAYAADGSRKRKAAYKAMLAFCDVAESAALGESVAGAVEGRQQAHDWRNRFLAYVAKGEELLRFQPEVLKDELETAWAMHAIE